MVCCTVVVEGTSIAVGMWPLGHNSNSGIQGRNIVSNQVLLLIWPLSLFACVDVCLHAEGYRVARAARAERQPCWLAVTTTTTTIAYHYYYY